MSVGQSRGIPSTVSGVWVGPLLVLAIAALLIWKPFDSEPPAKEFLIAAGPHLRGVLEINAETRLRVSLDPLHDGQRRQEFDGAALAQRLGLGEGEPWRLRLVAVGEVPAAALEGVRILDGEDPCLAPILDGLSQTEGGVQDPLLGLFQPLSGSGEAPEWELVLWGSPPKGDGRLECSWGSASLLTQEGAEEAAEAVVNEVGSEDEDQE